MPYSNEVLKRFENPTYAGSLDKNDPNVGTGLVGAPACGDVLRLQIMIDPVTELITEARFKTFGCGSAISASQLACEMLQGKSVDAAHKIDNAQIVNELSLMPIKVHCSVLAEDAIKGAIADWRKKQAMRSGVQQDNER